MSSLRPSPDSAPNPAGKPGPREVLRPDCAHPRDLLLVERVARREPAALEEFTARMQCIPRFLWVRNVKLGSVLGREELEDVAQDVVVAIWRKLGDYRGEAMLETWVMQFCEFDLRNARRRLVRRRGVPLEEIAEIVGEGTGDESGDLEAVYLALGKLPPDESVVVRLKNFDELTFDQIGERLAMSPNTAKTKFYRALEKLRSDLRRRQERKE